MVFAAFVLVFGCATIVGQTQKEFEAKYGRPSDKVYSVSEHIQMTATYAADGQVCFMRLNPKRSAPGAGNPDDSLLMDEVLNFIDDLVPKGKRGARKDLFGISDLGGGVIWTHFNYERVTFTFVSFFRQDKLPSDWPAGEALALDFDIDEKAIEEAKRKEAMRPDNELIRERTGKPKYLEIRWKERRCVERQAQSNNGMHLTADTLALMFFQRCGAAGDAGR